MEGRRPWEWCGLAPAMHSPTKRGEGYRTHQIVATTAHEKIPIVYAPVQFLRQVPHLFSKRLAQHLRAAILLCKNR